MPSGWPPPRPSAEFCVASGRTTSSTACPRTGRWHPVTVCNAALLLADAAAIAGRAPALFVVPMPADDVAGSGSIGPGSWRRPGDLEVEAHLAVAAAWYSEGRTAWPDGARAATALDLALPVGRTHPLEHRSATRGQRGGVPGRPPPGRASSLTLERVELLHGFSRQDPDRRWRDRRHLPHGDRRRRWRRSPASSTTPWRPRPIQNDKDSTNLGLAHMAAHNFVLATGPQGRVRRRPRPQAAVMLDGWERLGRPSAGWMGPSFHVAAMTYGLTGDADGYQRWLQHASDVSAGGLSGTFRQYGPGKRGPAYLGTWNGPPSLGDLSRRRNRRHPLAPYTLAVAAEVAVLQGAADQREKVALVKPFATENRFVAAHLARIEARLTGDQQLLAESLAQWEAIGSRFERACTLLLYADRAEEAERELAALGCPPSPRLVALSPRPDGVGGPRRPVPTFDQPAALEDGHHPERSPAPAVVEIVALSASGMASATRGQRRW